MTSLHYYDKIILMYEVNVMNARKRFPMTAVGIERIKEYKEELKAKMNPDKQRVSMKQFTFLCQGSASFRRIDGIEEHMGFEQFIDVTNEQKVQIKKMLEHIYQISDVESLDKVLGQFSRYHQEYIQFTSFWNNQPLFDIKQLDEKAQSIFEYNMAYASLLKEVVGEQGFYGFITQEIVTLCRIAYACDIIDLAGFKARCYPFVTQVAKLFQNWAEYAASVICGALYYNVRNGMKEEESVKVFHLQKTLFDHLFNYDAGWKNHPWLIKKEKEFFIPKEKIYQLLQDWEGGDMCIASDRIMCDGRVCGYMYRVTPQHDWDSGWRFLAGDEDQAYLDDPDNTGLYKLNTLVNYDPEIQPYLYEEYGSVFARKEDLLFHKIK